MPALDGSLGGVILPPAENGGAAAGSASIMCHSLFRLLLLLAISFLYEMANSTEQCSGPSELENESIKVMIEKMIMSFLSYQES